MGLYISASGIVTALRRNSITANNIANLDTPGFSASRALSEESPGGGVNVGAITRDDSPGPILSTNQPLDVASASGYFRVALPDGTTAYTRDGHFGLNAQGDIVTTNGARLDPPINVPANATSVTVSRDGVVSATVPGQLEPQTVGRIQVYQFQNPGGLTAIGENLFQQSGASGNAMPLAPQPQTLSGALTGSNVDLVTESVNSIVDTQTARANINAFRAQSDVLGELINLIS